MAPLTLGYWDIRGVSESIRYLLHYKKVEFHDKRYHFHEDEWKKDKYNLGLEFPNLPYLFDGDVKLTQSTTILRYLAEKYDMGGKTPQDRLRVSLIEQQIIDMRFLIGRSCFFTPEVDKARTDLCPVASDYLKAIENSLGDKEFLVGDSVTYVDFLLSEVFDFYRYVFPDACRDCVTLKAHQARIVGLPELQEYLHSSTYTRWPVFGNWALFGGGGEETERG